MKLVTNLRTLLVALWLGAALFFSFAVAPSAFAALPSRELAGAVVNRTLSIVNYAGLAVGLILLASAFLMPGREKGVRFWVEQGLLLFLTVACAVGQFVIGARLRGLREEIARPIDEVAIDDPLRLAFNDLHSYSVWVLSAAIIAAIIIFFLISERKRSSGIWWK